MRSSNRNAMAITQMTIAEAKLNNAATNQQEVGTLPAVNINKQNTAAPEPKTAATMDSFINRSLVFMPPSTRVPMLYQAVT